MSSRWRVLALLFTVRVSMAFQFQAVPAERERKITIGNVQVLDAIAAQLQFVALVTVSNLSSVSPRATARTRRQSPG